MSYLNMVSNLEEKNSKNFGGAPSCAVTPQFMDFNMIELSENEESSAAMFF